MSLNDPRLSPSATGLHGDRVDAYKGEWKMTRMSNKEREQQRFANMINALQEHDVESSDVWALRRISMQLHRWHELECGIDNGGVERDETTGKTYWYNAMSGRRSPTPDRETGARKRLAAIMAKTPALRAYVQGDPRGVALYILRPDDAPAGQEDSHYSRGIAVY